MWRHVWKYPFSLLITLTVIYLSFFRPPEMGTLRFPCMDKVVHFGMYAGLSGMLWLEFLRNHIRETVNPKRGFIGASICPVIFGGIIELLQAYLTPYRSGDWLDFLTNVAGVATATLIAWRLVRPWICKHFVKP